MLGPLLIILAASTAATAQGEPTRHRGSNQPVEIDADPPPGGTLITLFDGYSPDITEYEIAGRFPEVRAAFRLRVTLDKRRTLLALTYGSRTVRVRLEGRRFHPLHVERIKVGHSRGMPRQTIIVSVPFGESQDRCWSNGDEIYPEITLFANADGIDSVRERKIANCQISYSNHPSSRGEAVIRGN